MLVRQKIDKIGVIGRRVEEKIEKLYKRANKIIKKLKRTGPRERNNPPCRASRMTLRTKRCSTPLRSLRADPRGVGHGGE